MVIRQAKLEDLEDIIAIEGTCFPPAEAAGAKEFHERFVAFGENFFVATKGQKVIGFINGCTTNKPELPDELYHEPSLHDQGGAYQTVFGLDVLPDYRNQGITGQLLEHLIQVSRARGKKGVVLTCKDHLIHYYEKFGFKHQGISASEHGGSKWNDMLLTFKE